MLFRSPLSAVEGMTQRQAVVALRDGFIGTRERLLGGGEFLACVLFRARSLSRLDGDLGLLDFLLGRGATRDGGEEARGNEEPRDGATGAKHRRQYTPCRG